MSEAGQDLDICCCGDYRRSHKDGVGPCQLGDLCRPVPCQKFRLYSWGPPDRDRRIANEDHHPDQPAGRYGDPIGPVD